MLQALKAKRAAIAAWCDAHLVPQWRRVHRLWSTWVTGVLALVGAYFGDPANSASWTSTLYGMPPEFRKLIPAALFLLLAFAPTLIRLWRQKPPGPAQGPTGG